MTVKMKETHCKYHSSEEDYRRTTCYPVCLCEDKEERNKTCHSFKGYCPIRD